MLNFKAMMTLNISSLLTSHFFNLLKDSQPSFIHACFTVPVLYPLSLTPLWQGLTGKSLLLACGNLHHWYWLHTCLQGLNSQ